MTCSVIFMHFCIPRTLQAFLHSLQDPALSLLLGKTNLNLQKPCRVLAGPHLHVWHCPQVQPHTHAHTDMVA